jgi:SAM-dependent methyltransferase
MKETPCPVCNASSRTLYTLRQQDIKKHLETYFETSISEDIDLIPYTMMECTNCNYTFSFPFIEGSGRFYSWITKQKDYYPKDRWEYHKVYEILQQNPSSDISVLDVGCGSGEFLSLLKGLPNISTVGVDTTPTSVQECHARNLEAYCMDIDRFLSENPKYRNHFHYAVTFHCLEHIADPRGFIKGILQTLKPGGSIFVSTPYSPMSFEVDWFDPLNHPPHHMGRWNARAYRELAKQLNMEAKFFMPAGFSAMKRAAISFVYARKGLIRQLSKLDFMLQAVRHPASLVSHVRQQLRRDKINGQTAAEVVLVQLTAPSKALMK